MSKIDNNIFSEINVLRKILTDISKWIESYRLLQEKYDFLLDVYLNTKDRKIRKIYLKKLKFYKKNISRISKNIDMSNLVNLFDKITKRLDILYKINNGELKWKE